jgi:proteasome accessory factor B
MRKVERLVNLVALLLDTRRPLTLDQVAELVPGYEATGESLRRMFERDKEELRGLGVPVERGPVDAWGNEEGYFIDPGAYAIPRLDLEPDERAALALAARAWSGANGEPAVLAGLAKLDLDPGAGPDAVRANLGGASPLLATLLEAVTSRKRIHFSYRPPGRPRSERHLEPYALVHRHGTWYVVGHDSDRGGLRSFRLSRIQSAVRMERPASRGPEFEVPDWFDPSGVLPTAGEPDASPAATVRAGEAAARLAELRGAKRDGDPGPDGRLTLRMPILDRQGFVAWALGNGVEIVEPAELRHEARRRLEALLDLVEEETGEGAVVRQATAAARRGSRPRGTGRQPGRRR